MTFKAVGIHVFAGGFTKGVQAVHDVDYQLESHGFGLETAQQMCGVETIDPPWPHIDAQWAFGNPRCTGFSCMTAGYNDNTHGAWSAQTQDVHDLCNYAVDRYDCVIWESVQQAFSVGRPLLDYLRDEVFAPKHYRICHIMLDASSWDNCQRRRRYFFVAYRDDRNFNIEPPELPFYEPSLYDAIYHMRDRETHEGPPWDADAHLRLTDYEKHCLPHLPNGWSLNMLARRNFNVLPTHFKRAWKLRTSEMPFSMHCISRLQWMVSSPTLHGSCGRFIHPDFNRPLTIGELSAIMGWDSIPVGKKPIQQIAKGIVPSIGTWLAQQVHYYLTDAWGSDDFESKYDHRKGVWSGRDTAGEREKIFHMTQYIPRNFDKERFPLQVHTPKYRFNLDQFGKPIRPWEEVYRDTIQHS